MKNFDRIRTNNKIQHFKETLDHVRRVQDNILVVCHKLGETSSHGNSSEMQSIVWEMGKFWQHGFQSFSDEVLILSEAMIQNLLHRLLIHDQSKFSLDEWPYFAEANYGDQLKKIQCGSPEYFLVLKQVIGPGLRHHYKVNDHHPEYHEEGGIMKMSIPAVVEMLCDWEAETHRHENGNILESVHINSERFGYGSHVKTLFRRFFRELLREDV